MFKALMQIGKFLNHLNKWLLVHCSKHRWHENFNTWSYWTRLAIHHQLPTISAPMSKVENIACVRGSDPPLV
eukprot:SAG31_NODE_3485_length_4211_cov_2.074903_5_plen_72_part_00